MSKVGPPSDDVEDSPNDVPLHADTTHAAGDPAWSAPIHVDANRFIPLDRSAADGEIEREVGRIFGATAFRIVEPDRVYLDGPNTAYHRYDPDIPISVQESGTLKWFRKSNASFDLCCEDSWSGVFVATQLLNVRKDEACVLIHLDDHRDMGPTLLLYADEQLLNPATGLPFDPRRPNDWEAAIVVGAIGIGNFVTPLLFQDRPLHVRHLADGLSAESQVALLRDSAQYALTGGLRFAQLRKSRLAATTRATYARDADARRLLEELPPGRLIVHVDLDYFLNDFNGNPGKRVIDVDEARRRSVMAKMDRLFEAIATAGRPVARWIVATSPGFCACRHWPWLLRELGVRVGVMPPPLPREMSAYFTM